ncbi:hypothetical protein C8R44DRAFT_735602 [Mycena epipterygia]|nr:hypothetical protein C8R44DRAFT_735602 [Mycena epipterygia]
MRQMRTTQCSEYGAFSTSLSADGPNDLDINASPARHHELLTTNEPPDGAELASIRAVISKTHACIAYLDTEISRLRQLEEEHAALSTYHSQNIAILSAEEDATRGALRDIFPWTLPSAHEALRHRRFDPQHTSPWVDPDLQPLESRRSRPLRYGLSS